MSAESSIKPVDHAQTLAVQADRLKPEPARQEVAPAKAKVDAAPVPGEKADNKESPQSNEVKKLIESLTGQNTAVSIMMDPETRQIIIKVLDTATGEVIRRLPPKDPNHTDDTSWKLTGLLLDATQ
jgi:flagellar protein FlaG